MMESQVKPLISDIHHFAFDDGPGIRSTVFLKGCPLACVWCHNPETQRREAEIAFYPQLCIDCGDCEMFCPANAISLENPARVIRNKCTACGDCAKVCPSTALKVVGRHYNGDSLTAELLKNRLFYASSGGGVTFSGGEATLYMDYLSGVMGRLKENNIHIALQTAGFFDLEMFKKKLIHHLDLIFYDIKFVDSQIHRRYTGVGNERILSNFLALLRESDATVIPRIPLVPGITAIEDNLTQIADFLRKAGCTRGELLPYNPGGLDKWTAIGQKAPAQLPHLMMKMEEEALLKNKFFDRLNA